MHKQIVILMRLSKALHSCFYFACKLLHCEYSAPPRREVSYVGIAKYQHEDKHFSYELLCGRTELGEELYTYNRTASVERSDEKLVLVYAGSMARDQCKALPKYRGQYIV